MDSIEPGKMTAIKEEEQSTSSFACTICNKTFKRKDNMKEHKMRHMKEKRFPCSDCKKSFTTKRELNNHVFSIHTGSLPYPTSYPCVVCQKTFSTESITLFTMVT